MELSPFPLEIFHGLTEIIVRESFLMFSQIFCCSLSSSYTHYIILNQKTKKQNKKNPKRNLLQVYTHQIVWWKQGMGKPTSDVNVYLEQQTSNAHNQRVFWVRWRITLSQKVEYPTREVILDLVLINNGELNEIVKINRGAWYHGPWAASI